MEQVRPVPRPKLTTSLPQQRVAMGLEMGARYPFHWWARAACWAC